MKSIQKNKNVLLQTSNNFINTGYAISNSNELVLIVVCAVPTPQPKPRTCGSGPYWRDWMISSHI